MTTSLTEPVPPAPTPAPAAGHTRPALPLRLIKAELLKIWTTSAWWVFGIMMLASTALALFINVLRYDSELYNAERALREPKPDFGERIPVEQGGPTPDQVAEMERQFRESIDIPKIVGRAAIDIFTSGQLLGLLFMVILGALIVTNEFFHQTATTTFLATPRRTSVILSKFAAAGILAVGFWVIVTAIDLAVGAAFLSAKGYAVPLGDTPVLRAIAMNLLAFVVWAVLGVSLGVLIRSQLGATITGSVLYLISWPVALTLFSIIYAYIITEDWVWQFVVVLPGVASMIMIQSERLQMGMGENGIILGPEWWAGALVLVGYGLLAGIIGTLITRKRDIS